MLAEVFAKGPTLTDAEKVAAWNAIATAWMAYCTGGTASFDWDHDSRPVMAQLTGHRAFEYLRRNRP